MPPRQAPSHFSCLLPVVPCLQLSLLLSRHFRRLFYVLLLISPLLCPPLISLPLVTFIMSSSVLSFFSLLFYTLLLYPPILVTSMPSFLSLLFYALLVSLLVSSLSSGPLLCPPSLYEPSPSHFPLFLLFSHVLLFPCAHISIFFQVLFTPVPYSSLYSLRTLVLHPYPASPLLIPLTNLPLSHPDFLRLSIGFSFPGSYHLRGGPQEHPAGGLSREQEII